MSTEPQSPPADPPAPDPEPSDVVEVQGRRMVPVDALIAERERVRTATDKRVREELEPFKAKAADAERLQADLEQVQPFIDHLRKHPELMQPPPTPDIPDVSTEDAEKYARRYELYTPTGLDVARAKQIIADTRAETRHIAQEAAREAVAPYAQSSFTAAARQNFVWAASQKAPDGSPLVDPQELAQLWQTFPPELAANPEVAKVILRAAVGTAVMSGKRPTRGSLEPSFTEPPGGGPGSDFQLSRVEQQVAKSIGLSDKQYAERAKTYRPDATNILGE